MGATHEVTVRDCDGEQRRLSVPTGTNLRRALLEADCSPYTPPATRLNCGGRGICATCGVRTDDAPSPSHWHDSLAVRFGYPRLSCQVTVDRDMTVALVDGVWGSRE
jgi:ferredoxin